MTETNLTPRSKLIVGSFGPTALLDECVNEVRAQLDDYPEIMIFGKPARQRRCVGFFSNTSEGYRYSRTLAASKMMGPKMQQLLEHVNAQLGLVERGYNGILVNKYKNLDTS